MFDGIYCSAKTALWWILSFPGMMLVTIGKLFFIYIILKAIQNFYFEDFTHPKVLTINSHYRINCELTNYMKKKKKLLPTLFIV